MILEFSQQNNLENISAVLFSLLTIFTTSPVCSGASLRLGIFEDERLESVDILETFLGPTSDQEKPADGENQNVFIVSFSLDKFTRSTFSQVSRKKIFFSTIDTLSPWDGAINSVRSVKNAGKRYNDRSLKISLCVQNLFLSH